ncbi:hypothetical protein N7455_004377 [Penicillium solitum]|uniref:uncharacterized protein n=1 Tax=Penicillium solitum TaxID=60172 RepID=UPI0032C4076B|nr:hypothetical protein N7455_004377 [Penicillium solitum]
MSSLLISSSLAAASFAMAFLVTESVLILIRKGKLATPSPPFLAWKITLGVSFVAVLSVLFFFQLLSLLFSGSSSASAALNKRGESSSGSSPHWSTHLYGVCEIVWGFHGAVMQQAAHWLNTSKWEAEKREKAAKANEERSLQTQVQELRQQVLALTSRILAVERTNAELERDITMLQKVALDKDSKS